jgi:hypothetical protein
MANNGKKLNKKLKILKKMLTKKQKEKNIVGQIKDRIYEKDEFNSQ